MKVKEVETVENVEKHTQNYEEIERENEKKLLNLIAEVMVNLTMKEFYETGDQVPEI